MLYNTLKMLYNQMCNNWICIQCCLLHKIKHKRKNTHTRTQPPNEKYQRVSLNQHCSFYTVLNGLCFNNLP